MLRVDYHFHPNLSVFNKLAINKCQKFWNKFVEQKINCIIVTEHSYRNPKRAYDFMLKTKPNNCFVFPGVEYITREGIDVVIFARTSSIYNIKELRSYKLSLDELVVLILSNKELFAFPAHPYTLGHTSIIKKLGYEKYAEFVNTLYAIEISNGVLDGAQFFMNKFSRIFKSKLAKITKTQNIPKEDYPTCIKFVAVGSDAHYPIDVGYCYEIECNGHLLITEENIFEKITNNFGMGMAISSSKKSSMIHNLRTLINSLNESLIKILFKI